ncbi:MAG: hypothetical protein IJO27_04810 [Bacilli bacterium]|nr:hypothetical protein [Bacilli bacterium]
MFDGGISLMSLNSVDDLKRVAINLNIKGKSAMHYTLILGYKPDSPNERVNYRYTVFTDESRNCYLLPSYSVVTEAYSEIGIVFGSVGLDEPLIIDEDDLEVRNMKKAFSEDADRRIMLENYEKYKDLNCYEKLSFYGLDYVMLDFDADGDTISFEDSIIEFNLRTYVDRNRFAMFEVISEKRIIVCYDEYGRLFAFGFADEKNLYEAIWRLRLAGFRQGFTKNCLGAKFHGLCEMRDISNKR